MNESTLAIIKPDIVSSKKVGILIQTIEMIPLFIAEMRKTTLTVPMAAALYEPLAYREFYPELVAFMTSGPCIILVLEGDNGIERWRLAMGATDPAKAQPATIRRNFGTSICYNAVHGSDSPSSARREIALFFPHR